MNVHHEVARLNAYIANAILEKRPIDPKLAKYALDLLEGRLVPLPAGTNACATGFPEVIDVSFDVDGIPTWIAHDARGTFTFRGFGLGGGPEAFVKIPKDWHVELVHGVSDNALIVAWPKEKPCVFDIHWDGIHRLVTEVGMMQARPVFTLWYDHDGNHFAAVFGLHEGRIACLDDPSLDRHIELGSHLHVGEVVERDGKLRIQVWNERTRDHYVIDDHGDIINVTLAFYEDVAVHKGRPVSVKLSLYEMTITVDDKKFELSDSPRRDAVYIKSYIINRGRDVILHDKSLPGLVDAITGMKFAPVDYVYRYAIAATDDKLFLAGQDMDGTTKLQIFDRTSGKRLSNGVTGVRAHNPSFRQFGDDMCVAFENGNWRVYCGADDTEWDTGIRSTDPIQLLPGRRAATWKFLDGTLYTRVVTYTG